MKKILVIGIIFLFIGVSVSSAISFDTKSTIADNEREEVYNHREIDKLRTTFGICWLILDIDDVTKEWNETLQEYVYTGITSGGFFIFWIFPSIIFIPVILPVEPGVPINVSKKDFYNPNTTYCRTRIFPNIWGGITVSHFEYGFYTDEDKQMMKDLYENHI